MKNLLLIGFLLCVGCQPLIDDRPFKIIGVKKEFRKGFHYNALNSEGGLAFIFYSTNLYQVGDTVRLIKN